MKIRLSWKCPEWDYDLPRFVRRYALDEDEVLEQLYALGAGEYMVVEFDLENNTATVVKTS